MNGVQSKLVRFGRKDRRTRLGIRLSESLGAPHRSQVLRHLDGEHAWGKTRKSLAVIHVPNGLSADLAAWRTQCPDPSPDTFIFSKQDGGFLDTDNYRKRVLHKLAKNLELPKLTFRATRRTIATLAQKKGIVKDVQGVLRHSRTATTTDVYMQEIPEAFRRQ